MSKETACARLSKELGGSWKYRGFRGWMCSDGRQVVPVFNGYIDEWGNHESGTPKYLLGMKTDVTAIVRPNRWLDRFDLAEAP